MKTAMMQLRDKLEEAIKVTELEIDPMSVGIRSGFKSIINEINKNMMEVEKDQLCDAYDSGKLSSYTMGSKYYLQTFTGNDCL